jgi:DNA-binding response OmpR family regulator
MRILVVEDEVLIALDVESVLRSAGYDVAGPVGNSEDATELGIGADIAFVDVHLSDGQTGPSLAGYLSQAHGVTVIFATANPEIVAADPHAIGALVKPVFATDLLSTIEYAAALRRGEPASAPPCLKRLQA